MDFPREGSVINEASPSSWQTRCSRCCPTNSVVTDWLTKSSYVKICSTHRLSKTVRARDLKFVENVHHPLCVTCHMSCVTCHVSHLMYHKSCFTRATEFWKCFHKKLKKSQKLFFFVFFFLLNFQFVLLSQTTKFHYILKSPKTKYHSTPTSAVHSIGSCRVHWYVLKFGCQGHQNGVQFVCRAHQIWVIFICWGHQNGVKFQSWQN